MSATTLKLEPSVAIRDIAILNDALAAALEADGDVSIDASDVDAIDTAGLQLLAAFANTMATHQRSVSLKSPSADFVARAEILGVAATMGLGAAAG